MIITIIQGRLIKVLVLAICLFLKKEYIKRCVSCDGEVDIEDYFFNNICDTCGASQGYDKEDFDNSNLNYCKGICGK